MTGKEEQRTDKEQTLVKMLTEPLSPRDNVRAKVNNILDRLKDKKHSPVNPEPTLSVGTEDMSIIEVYTDGVALVSEVEIRNENYRSYRIQLHQSPHAYNLGLYKTKETDQ